MRIDAHLNPRIARPDSKKKWKKVDHLGFFGSVGTGTWTLSLSNPRGYEERSLVRARVSRLALWRPVVGTGGLALLSVEPVSIWKGNDPRPDDAVDTVDKAKARLLGGAGRSSSFFSITFSVDAVLSLFCGCGDGRVTLNVC